MDGASDHRQLSTSNFSEGASAFSPDGSLIAFVFEELPTSQPIGRITIIPNHSDAAPIRVTPGGSDDPDEPFPFQPRDENGDPLAANSGELFWRP